MNRSATDALPDRDVGVMRGNNDRRGILRAGMSGLVSLLGICGGCESIIDTGSLVPPMAPRNIAVPGAPDQTGRTESDERSETLAIRILRIPPSSDVLDRAFGDGDPSGMDPDVRRRLADNGIRVTEFLGSEPAKRLIESVRPSAVDQVAMRADIDAGKETRLPLKPGRCGDLPLHHPNGTPHVAMVRGEQGLVGRRLSYSQHIFGIDRLADNFDGSIPIRIEPRIEYGLNRPQFASTSVAIRIDHGRQNWTLDDLAVDWAAAPGRSLLIAATDPPRGLGAAMFCDGTSGVGSEISDAPKRRAVLMTVNR